MVGGGGAVARSDDLRAEVKQAARALAPSSEKKPSTLIEFRGFLGDARVGVRGRNNVKARAPPNSSRRIVPGGGLLLSVFESSCVVAQREGTICRLPWWGLVVEVRWWQDSVQLIARAWHESAREKNSVCRHDPACDHGSAVVTPASTRYQPQFRPKPNRCCR